MGASTRPNVKRYCPNAVDIDVSTVEASDAAPAAVFAAQDPRWAERPIAAVVVKPGKSVTKDELAAHLAPLFAKFWLPDDYVFVDAETFEPVTLSGDMVGDMMQFLRENDTCKITFYEGKALSMELPQTVTGAFTVGLIWLPDPAPWSPLVRFWPEPCRSWRVCWRFSPPSGSRSAQEASARRRPRPGSSR